MNETITRVCLRLTLRLLLATATPAAAHDHARPELDGWYAGLHNRHTIPCCDGSDAARVEDADWDTACTINNEHGIIQTCHYRVRLEGQWVDVPDEAVVDGPNKDGRTLVWPYFINGMPAVRCFMPGVMG
jgi:hypothetical protein